MAVGLRFPLAVTLVCIGFQTAIADGNSVTSLREEVAVEYDLDPSFYKKATEADGILIATSERRLTINASYWCLGMEKSIIPDSSVRYVGTYTPLASGFNYDKLGVVPQKPETYR